MQMMSATTLTSTSAKTPSRATNRSLSQRPAVQKQTPKEALALPGHIRAAETKKLEEANAARSTSTMVSTDGMALMSTSAVIEPEDPPIGGTAPAVISTDEWFAYDAMNRLTVRKGSLVDGQVVADELRVDSARLLYNARGDVSSELRVERVRDAEGKVVGDQRVTVKLEKLYDERGRLVREQTLTTKPGTKVGWLVPQREFTYYADTAAVGSRGKVMEEITYFGPTDKLEYGGELYVLWNVVREKRFMVYDAEGRVVREERHGRPPLPGGTGTVDPRDPRRPGGPGALKALAEVTSGLPSALATWRDAPLVHLSSNHYRYDALISRTGINQGGWVANGKLTAHATEVKALGYGEEASDHYDSGTLFSPYVQYRLIRGYSSPSSGGGEGWVIGARQTGAYNPNLADWGAFFTGDIFSGDKDAPQTVSRLEDVWGRVTHQYDYLDIPGYQRKNQHQVRAFAYNAEGQVVSRRDYWAVGGINSNGQRSWQQASAAALPNRRYVISNGQQWAELTQGAPARNEDPAVEGTQQLSGSTAYSAGGGTTTAQANETLSAVSRRVYGDSRYWYVLAEANGFGTADEALPGGILLRVPELGVTRNSADTFKPYNPNEALGSALPALPYIAPSPNSCGVVGQLIMVVVAVIATVYTAGAASGLAASMGGGLGGTLSAGASVLGGTSGLGIAGVGYAALGGAMGSITSQAVGMAMGNVQRFSWRGVATSALTAGVGAGVGAAAQALGWTRTATAVASGLGSSVANAGVNGGFSWRQVAANVIGSAVGSAVGNAVGGRLGGALGFDLTVPTGQFQQQMLSGFIGGMVSQATSSGLMGNSRIDPVNALGDALGNSLVGRWSGQHARAAGAAYLDALEARLGRPWQPARQRWGLIPPDSDMAVNELPGAGAPASADWVVAMAGRSDAGRFGAAPNPITYTVQSGDTLSTIIGTSGPLALGRIMALNGLRSSTLYPGQKLVLDGELPYTDESVQALGQATLNSDNARLAAMRAQSEADVAAARARTFRFFDTPASTSAVQQAPIVAASTAPTMSRLEHYGAGREAWKASNQAYYQGWGGSVLGDMAMYAGLYASDAGVAITGLFQTGYALVTDGRSRQQIADGIGYAVSNPGQVYQGAVRGTADWMALPLDQQMRTIGSSGFEFVATAGVARLGAAGLRATGDIAKDAATGLAQRRWYEKEVRFLEEVGVAARAGGMGEEETARMLNAMRREIGVEFKLRTPERFRGQIFERNLIRYGDEYGPTIEYHRVIEGKSWQQIIESAARPDGSNIWYINWSRRVGLI